MNRIKKSILYTVIALSFVGCEIETLYPESKNLIKGSNTQKLELFSKKSLITEIVDDYDHPIFKKFINDSHVNLSRDTKYIFSVPIPLNNLKNLAIEGNGATICFPIIGIGIQIDYSSNIRIQNLIIDNTDDNGIAYYSNPEEGRINITNSDYIILDKLNIKEQGSTPNNSLNHIQINVYNSTKCDILNSTIQSSHGELIVLDGSNDCKVINNKTFKGQSGIATKGRILSWYRGYRSLIKDNYVYGTSTASITINDRQSIVENNIIKGDSTSFKGGPGIRFGHYQDKNGNDYVHLRAKNCIARMNKIFNFLIPNIGAGGSSATGIKVDASVGTDGYGLININNNVIKNCRKGITISNAPGQSGEIKNNIIETNTEGISIFSPDANNLSDFQIIDNHITSAGIGYEEYAVRLFRSNASLIGNTINLNSIYKYAKAIEIKENSIYARVDIINNTLNVNGNYGIHHSNKEMDSSKIKTNIINNSRVGMLLKSKNSIISNNTIKNADDYGILFWDGSDNNIVENNFISVSFSAAIRLHNTKSINITNNFFELLAGESLYAVYKSAYNFDPTIIDNSHNWPNSNN